MLTPAGTGFAGLPAAELDSLTAGQVVILGAAEASRYEPGKPNRLAGREDFAFD